MICYMIIPSRDIKEKLLSGHPTENETYLNFDTDLGTPILFTDLGAILKYLDIDNAEIAEIAEIQFIDANEIVQAIMAAYKYDSKQFYKIRLNKIINVYNA